MASFVLVCSGYVLTGPGAFAQGGREAGIVSGSAEGVRERNKNTVGIIAGDYAGTHLHIVTDLASVLDNGSELRVLPVVGQGSLQNIEDLLYLSGIDIAIVQSDVLAYLQERPGGKDLADRVNYIVKLFNEEFHLVGGPDIRSIDDLNGKAVSFGPKGGGTAVTAAAVFAALGVNVEVEHHDLALSLEKVRKGELAAAAYVGGKPINAIAALAETGGLHLVPVDYAEPLRAEYLPAKFTVEDYPNLVGKGQRVGSISVGSVMAVYNWGPNSKERYERVVKFIEAFLISHKDLKLPPRHPKWRELAIGVTIPGWHRYPPAARMIEALVASPDSMGGFMKSSLAPAVPPTKPTVDTAAAEPAAMDEPSAARDDRVAADPDTMSANKNPAIETETVSSATTDTTTAGDQNTETITLTGESKETANNPFDRVGSVVDGFAPKTGKVEDRVDSAAVHDGKVRRID